MQSIALVHFALLVALTFGVYYEEWVIERPNTRKEKERRFGYAGNNKYLTHLNMLLQCGYFLLALVNDVAGSNARDPRKQTKLQKARDWVFTALAFPLGTFVSFIFWSIYLVDRELIMPVSMDPWFPTWLNHVMHTLPMLGAMFEQVTVYHTHQRGNKRLLPMFTVYLLYLLWLVFIRFRAGFWVYPVFDALGIKGRIVFLVLLSAPALFCYVIGERIHVAVWGYEPVHPSSPRKGKTH